MKLEVTRDVVSDLWPLCRSGEASDDSRALIDAYLAEDVSFAAQLKESEQMNRIMPHVQLSPEAERHLLHDASERARIKLLLIGGAIALAALALISLVFLFLVQGRLRI